MTPSQSSKGASNISREDELALVKQARRGDADAFGVLYTRHLDAIYRYVLARISDAQLAEDLTEEIFVRAWEALPRYKVGKHPFSSWLYRIAHNLVVDSHRKKQPEAADNDFLEALPDRRLTPEELLARKQDFGHLARAVQQLDEEAQQVVVLRFVEGLTHKEVARITGKTEAASRVIQHRALATLYDLMEGGEHHE